VGKDNRRLYVCPACNGAQTIAVWKTADLPDEPEAATEELCRLCDGSGHILGPNT
jgi:hypothetical protein